MAKRLFGTLILGVLLAFPGWAQTTGPSVRATPPQPSWSDLTVHQKIILAPLSDEWDSFKSFRQKKWLHIAATFLSMSPEEQRRIHGQMQEWRKLTPEQRQMARQNYKTARKFSASQKQELLQKWEQYSNLPEKEKQRLKQQATRNPLPPLLAPTPSGIKAEDSVLLTTSSSHASQVSYPPSPAP